ncbi:MAG: type II toxin-antitoxin system HicA family toxin [Beijerinckiaceae bacterium]
MKIRRRLEQEGWKLHRAKKHLVYKHPDKKGRVIVPRGRGEIPPGTADSIAKQAGWI